MQDDPRGARLKAVMSAFEHELMQQQRLGEAYVRSLAEQNALWARITSTLLSQNHSRIETCFANLQALVAEDDDTLG
jgi:hypothetical protein